jgi:hypothetical protein
MIPAGDRIAICSLALFPGQKADGITAREQFASSDSSDYIEGGRGHLPEATRIV